jgi:serine/threonine protein kinase
MTRDVSATPDRGTFVNRPLPSRFGVAPSAWATYDALVQLSPGSRIGAYELESILGKGAFGVVWLARRPGKVEPFAIKVLHPEVALSAEGIERFEREAWALSRLTSPHIARMHEVLTGPATPMALVMEYVEGELLADVFRRARFTVEDALGLGIGLLSGVVEMHSLGIIHRDLKPENVILRPNEEGWHAVIVDFNLARVKDPKGKGSHLTKVHAAIGTVPYMSPEQLLDARRVTEASDVYSIGTILFRAVTGAFPFGSQEQQAEKLRYEPPPLVVQRTDRRARLFEQVVNRALRRRPSERYGAAGEMLEGLMRAAVEGVP